MPGPTGNLWETELKVWHARSKSSDVNAFVPPTEIFILTSNGEEKLTDNPREVRAIVVEIHRQLDQQNKRDHKG